MIDFECFMEWAEAKFSDVIISGNEIKINSLWTEDQGHHLWCNPSKNAYHCWKTDKSGNLYGLVSEVDGIPPDEVMDMLGGSKLRKLEARVREMFIKKRTAEKVLPSLQLPPNTFRFEELAKDHFLRVRAEEYLKLRKLSVDGLLLCTNGVYGGRIVIPYYGVDGNLIYFNCRDVTGKSKLRYRGPPKEIGVGKGQVLWMRDWKKGKIYLTEGEFDAMSLEECGFRAGACGGKELSVSQRKLIHGWEIVLAFDEDRSGEVALYKIGGELTQSNFPNVSYVRPAKGYKDWNNMLVQLGPQVTKMYVTQHQRSFNRLELK